MGFLRPTGLSPNSSAWHSSGVLWAEPGAELGRASPHLVSQQTLKEHFLRAWPWWSCPPGLMRSQPFPSPKQCTSSTRAVWVFAPTDRELRTQQGWCLCCRTTGALVQPGTWQVKGGEAGDGGRRLPGHTDRQVATKNHSLPGGEAGQLGTGRNTDKVTSANC